MEIAGCSLAELIDDPLTGLIMKSDGVHRHELKLLLEQVARKRLLATQLANPCRPRLTAETRHADIAEQLMPPTHAASLSGPQENESCREP